MISLCCFLFVMQNLVWNVKLLISYWLSLSHTHTQIQTSNSLFPPSSHSLTHKYKPVTLSFISLSLSHTRIHSTQAHSHTKFLLFSLKEYTSSVLKSLQMISFLSPSPRLSFLFLPWKLKVDLRVRRCRRRSSKRAL